MATRKPVREVHGKVFPMKKSLVILLVILGNNLHAQVDFSSNTLKIGGGYARDFPGLSGYALTVEYAHSMNEFLEGSIGIKRISMSGYPRTTTVKEYTKASTIDFNLFFVPMANETNLLKVGLGYSFSFYKKRRSYPVIETHGAEKVVSWPIQDAKGRATGIIVSGEYECILSSNLSMGLRASLCKAYDRVFYIGPFVGIKL
jgi:hypothetical protein